MSEREEAIKILREAISKVINDVYSSGVQNEQLCKYSSDPREAMGASVKAMIDITIYNVLININIKLDEMIVALPKEEQK